jgi:small subunit ribosomal protein S16
MAFFRIVAADSRAPRDGRFIEQLGYYDPLKNPPDIKVDTEKAIGWLGKGAQPSETVRSLFSRIGIMQTWHEVKKGKSLDELRHIEDDARKRLEAQASMQRRKKEEAKARKAEEKAEEAKAEETTEEPAETPAEETTEATAEEAPETPAEEAPETPVEKTTGEAVEAAEPEAAPEAPEEPAPADEAPEEAAAEPAAELETAEVPAEASADEGAKETKE